MIESERSVRLSSPLAYIVYTVTVLLGLKVLGANLTWAMVFFPVWGVGIMFILMFILVSLFTKGLIK